MENVKKAHGCLPWKLVWDSETKVVLVKKKIEGEMETINELYEADSEEKILKKIDELGLKYIPEEEWI